ncbi:hypothetical protein NDU88_003424 [Pleurodeles waltl]|uniref:Uncharacterized protein n=1 Tax=Pleurodeles waltl TaxID=8319 RepID=A0AAV7M5B9_PLEWA|nr:hypothetical protein NDU88_003424 [Pleurodeles waltl]
MEGGLDMSAVERVKQAFTERPVLLLPSAHADEDDLHDSNDEAGPPRPWRQTQPLSEPFQAAGSSDMLELEDLVYPRSSEWVPSD